MSEYSQKSRGERFQPEYCDAEEVAACPTNTTSTQIPQGPFSISTFRSEKCRFDAGKIDQDADYELICALDGENMNKDEPSLREDTHFQGTEDGQKVRGRLPMLVIEELPLGHNNADMMAA
jgi:hypothetical protein